MNWTYQETWSTLSCITWIRRVLKLAVLVQRKGSQKDISTKGPNFVHSVDGHDKPMEYQNCTYPLAICGCIDMASRTLLWLHIWVSNSDPQLIGRWYVEYFYETRTMASYLWMNRGTETGTIAAMHAFLRRHHVDVDPLETVIYGPSTSHQVSLWIEGFLNFAS